MLIVTEMWVVCKVCACVWKRGSVCVFGRKAVCFWESVCEGESERERECACIHRCIYCNAFSANCKYDVGNCWESIVAIIKNCSLDNVTWQISLKKSQKHNELVKCHGNQAMVGLSEQSILKTMTITWNYAESYGCC